jgi:hypothetical protein
MAKDKLPKRLFKNPARVSHYEVDRSRRSAEKEVRDRHEDVLQNIEFALVTAWRENRAVDDRAVSQALRASMTGKPPEDLIAVELFKRLTAMRSFREDMADDIWMAALRKIDDSVRLHSSRNPGDVGYLRFADQFIV